MHAERKTGGPGAAREKQIVLVVDGDPVSQFYTTVFLQRLNYHVVPVRSAEEALVIMELTAPLIVITEITLGQMSGLDFLKHLKQDPQRKGIPVLVYTAARSYAQRSACIQAGCADYLVHTSDHNVLYEAVQKATEQTPRHFVRLDTWLNAVMTAPGNEDQTALVTAISEHGMFVTLPKPLPLGAAAWFTVLLENGGGRKFSTEGKVLYSSPGGLGRTPGMGVKFVNMAPDQAKLIKGFIEERLTAGLKASEDRKE